MKKNESRRGFIKKVLWTLFGLEIAYLSFDFLNSKTKSANRNSFFEIGNINNFEVNNIYPFASEGIYLSVLDDGGLLAISVKCTHLGCVVQPDNKGFHCPCHASSFDKYGEVKSPPATRALDIFPISINKSIIYVDTQNPIKRKGFDKSQLIYS
ncbi:MAG TPA: ubiquinol-cytochrome c reductase iron-sulfur subunit [Saprospiraceae bacterium]|jgi:Rieske Fe-S protein|nr:ubiquinol-cytochrome c reductase iron-sulfur subunit [Saprospiraceae bacterium]